MALTITLIFLTKRWVLLPALTGRLLSTTAAKKLQYDNTCLQPPPPPPIHPSTAHRLDGRGKKGFSAYFFDEKRIVHCHSPQPPLGTSIWLLLAVKWTNLRGKQVCLTSLSLSHCPLLIDLSSFTIDIINYSQCVWRRGRGLMGRIYPITLYIYIGLYIGLYSF